MSTIAISQLPIIALNSNTTQSIFVIVDRQSDATGQISATSLAGGLYSNNALVVGTNPIIFSNTIAQFSGNDPNFTQINLQNFNPFGAADVILTADTGTNSNAYIDLGINNSQWNPSTYGQTSQYPYDGYLIVQGPGSSTVGNLIIGTAVANTNMVVAVGGQYTNNITALFSPTTFKTYLPVTFADGSTQNTAAASLAYSQASFSTANSALQNTTGTFAGTLTVTGNVVASYFVGNVVGSSIANTIQWQQSVNSPTQSYGQLWYSANDTSLIEDTDIAGDRPIIGKVLFERIYNSTGSTIAANSWVRVTSNATSNNIPYVLLADATTAANSQAIGIVKNAIATGAYGIAYVQGIVNNLNTAKFSVGDTLFLTTTPGIAANTPVSGSNVSVTLGKVLSSSATTGKIQVFVQSAPQYGRANGAVVYANNNVLVTSNTIFISDSAQTVSLNGSISMANGLVRINNVSLPANTALLRIDASTTSAAQTPTANGYILQLQGIDGTPTRFSVDATGASGTTGAYALFVGRTARGTAGSPTAVQSGDLLARWVGNGYGTTGYSTTNGGATIDVVAIDNFSDTTKGTLLNVSTTIVGTNTRSVVTTFTNNSVAVLANTLVLSSANYPSTNGALYVSTANTVRESANILILDSIGTLNVSNSIITTNVVASSVNATYHYGNTTTAVQSLVGTWTPNVAFSTSNSGISYTAANGNFVKTGRQVTAYFTIAGAQTSTGNMWINGLPFQAATGTGSMGITIIAGQVTGPAASAMGYISGNVISGATSTQLYYTYNSGNSSDTNAPFTGSVLGTPYLISGQISYISAS